MNASMALIPQSSDERQMRLIYGSFSNPAPGRTLHQVYSQLGDYVGRHASRAAHRWGRGPYATADRIAAFFGTGQQRMAKLDELRGGACSYLELEEECSKLVKYALPSESAQTQVEAFKCIVTTVTRYHGTRELFLKSKHLQRAGNTEALITAVWVRADDTQPREWDFYCKFAATCLSEKTVSAILGNISPSDSACISTEGGLSVIERLLIASECSANSTYDAVAQRYLAGILELPAFWRESGSIHINVFSKILDRIIRVLQDLGLELKEDEDETDIIFDDEGIDSFASAVLVGILDWRQTNLESQYWYCNFSEIAEPLVPMSSALATGPDIKDIVPDTSPKTLDILISVDDTTAFSQIHTDRISLRSIGDALDVSIHELDFAPGRIVYTEAASSRWPTVGMEFSSSLPWAMRARKKVPENEPASARTVRARIPGWLRSFLRPPDLLPSESPALDSELSKIPAEAPWVMDLRGTDIKYKYKKNEVFVDVEETVNLSMSAKGVTPFPTAFLPLISIPGTVLRANVDGHIKGRPECKFVVNDKLARGERGANDTVELEDCRFHQCVQRNVFDATREINFIPPDGEFELMRYRSTSNVRLPLRVIPTITETATQLSYAVTIQANFNDNHSVKKGKAKYVPGENVVVWNLPRLRGGKECTLSVTTDLTNTTRHRLWTRPPIDVEFELNEVYEKGNYNCMKWVRYRTVKYGISF
ncbi:Clathrin adaptor, mu subunit [Mycena venus]|uniref:Clathrin adaptor, mu subunit n=1 Tax=Mycena venus TaxID=2733690 RepID=A0A8H6Y397_9AGAR|nr:Clathrin adaptor, mu subunit [Mycena venus]